MNYKQLKILAILCMAFDHVVRIFPLYRMFSPLADRLWSAGHDAAADWLLDGLPFYLMLIGRLAAPIFLFCVAQGLLHTRDASRYLKRILVTAVIAQIPYVLFNLAEYRVDGIADAWVWQDTGLNICFTLALGLAALALYRRLAERGHPLSWVVVCAAATALARLLSMEGGRGYILLIFTFYLTRNRRSHPQLPAEYRRELPGDAGHSGLYRGEGRRRAGLSAPLLRLLPRPLRPAGPHWTSAPPAALNVLSPRRHEPAIFPQLKTGRRFSRRGSPPRTRVTAPAAAIKAAKGPDQSNGQGLPFQQSG